MNEDEIFEKLRPLIAEVTGRRSEEVRPESRVIADLGAESIDLVDLSFLVEERFGVTIEANEIERRARALMPGGAYDAGGVLTPEALAGLREALPEVDPGRIGGGLRKADIPSLLTVGVFVRLIRIKLDEREEAVGKEAPCRS